GAGTVNVEATSTDTADPGVTSVAISVGDIGAVAAQATTKSNTLASISGAVDAASANVSAVSNKTADASTFDLSVGIVDLNGVALSGIADALPDDLPIPVIPGFN